MSSKRKSSKGQPAERVATVKKPSLSSLSAKGQSKKRSKEPKPSEAEMAEVLSDSQLEVADSEEDEGHENEDEMVQAEASTKSTLPSSSKRKSRDSHPEDDGSPRKGDDDRAAFASAPEESPVSKRKTLALRVKADDDVVSSDTPAAAGKAGPALPLFSHVHVRAGNDEQEQFYTPLEATARNPLESATVPSKEEEGGDDDGGSEEDDDAPPEAISSHAAAAQTLKLAQGAAKAAELQATAQRQKRQRRDALFKAQAQKRALEEEEQRAAAAKMRTKRKAIDDDEPEGVQCANSSAIPGLLPAEFLESDDEEDEGGISSRAGLGGVGVRKPKKIKFETAERIVSREEAKKLRGPADQRVGSTVYRVLGSKTDVRLAPKQSKYTAFQKKALLARGRPEVRRTRGFLVKK